MEIVKIIRRKIAVCIIFVMALSLFCCVNPQEVSAKTRNKVNAKKQGITYTKSIHMRTCDRDSIFISAWSDYKIKNIKTDSKYLKVSEFYGCIDVETSRPGTYHVTYEVKQKKKKTVKLKTTVYVTEYIMPFKSITIDGKKLKEVEGGYWQDDYSGYEYYVESNYRKFFYSPKHKGKMKITPTPGYKIERILISDADYHSSKWDIERYSSGIDFENDEVENGDLVELNYIASGVKEFEDDILGHTIKCRDEYKYKTAYTHVSICYWDKYLKGEAWMEIVVCVDAVK